MWKGIIRWKILQPNFHYPYYIPVIFLMESFAEKQSVILESIDQNQLWVDNYLNIGVGNGVRRHQGFIKWWCAYDDTVDTKKRLGIVWCVDLAPDSIKIFICRDLILLIRCGDFMPSRSGSLVRDVIHWKSSRVDLFWGRNQLIFCLINEGGLIVW